MRQVKSAGNLVADVQGHIEDVEGVLKITRIHLHYRVTVPAGGLEKARRALDTYADKCPAYQSVKGCIECTWDAEIQEE